MSDTSTTEVVVEDAPEVEDNSTTVVIAEPTNDAPVTEVDLDHEHRLTVVESALAILAPVVERIDMVVTWLDERMQAVTQQVVETQEAVVETQEVIVETAEATPTKEDDEVVEDEVPTDTVHRWWR